MNKENPPSIEKTAFECPHCGAYTTQYWYKLYAMQTENNEPPHFMTKETMAVSLDDPNTPQKIKLKILNAIDIVATGLVLSAEKEDHYYSKEMTNLNISSCFACKKIAVWRHYSLIFPKNKSGVTPNQDLPDDIIKDFEEARSIVNESPRGAAALLRLCVQKLCIHLGEKGKNLDKDIASLVDKGLNPLIQKSLDIVRVIGNEAVHPGTLDLNDNPDIVNQLFVLINSIADQMITHPKNVEEAYNKLPENKRKGIEERGKKQL